MGLLALTFLPGLTHLHRRRHHAEAEALHLRERLRAGTHLPRRRRVGATLGGLGLPGVREVEDPLALDVLAANQALVLEELQGRVDRAGAGPPHAAAASRHLLVHLVAMHRALVEQAPEGCPHVASARAGSPAPGAESL